MPRLGGVEAELSRAEFDKFAAPLLLLHGLWSEARIWRPAAGYLSHRGWNSFIPSWRGAARSHDDLLALIQRAADELDRPVVVGHDLGGLIALELRRVRAAVAIAPLPWGVGAPPHPFSRPLAARLARWRGAEIRPAAAAVERLFGARSGVVPETSQWLEELRNMQLRTPEESAPRLVVGGADDPCARPRWFESLAQASGAEVRLYEAAGHNPISAGPWQTVIADVHRWLVRELGEDVLLLRGDEDLRDDM